jgi:hypothetical protein
LVRIAEQNLQKCTFSSPVAAYDIFFASEKKKVKRKKLKEKDAI